MPRPRPRGSAMDYESYLEKLDRTDEWGRKGATLSDKTARKEFGLTQDEIYDAIEAGPPQKPQAASHGTPWHGVHVGVPGRGLGVPCVRLCWAAVARPRRCPRRWRRRCGCPAR